MNLDVQLFRIDDRLIHGQVMIGWAKYLKSERIILCDNEVYKNKWEAELYLSCVPKEIETFVFGTKQTTEYLLNKLLPNDKTIVLVKAPNVVIEIIDAGYLPRNINIGGIHYIEKRKKYLPYLFLNDSEVKEINYLLEKNISIYCQDLPTSKLYYIKDLI